MPGTGIGGVLTVLLDTGNGWRGTYALTAVLAVALAGAARLVLPDLGTRTRRRVDVAGPVLLVGALSSVLVALVGTRSGFGTGAVVAFLGPGRCSASRSCSPRTGWPNR